MAESPKTVTLESGDIMDLLAVTADSVFPSYSGRASTDEQVELLADRISGRVKTASEVLSLPALWGFASMSLSPTHITVTYGETLGTQISISTSEVITLRQRVRHLESVVEKLVSALPSTAEKVIVLRTLTRDEAKREIIQLFESGDTIDYGDIAEELGIELPLIVDICKELEKEGTIGSPD